MNPSKFNSSRPRKVFRDHLLKGKANDDFQASFFSDKLLNLGGNYKVSPKTSYRWGEMTPLIGVNTPVTNLL